MRYILGVLGLFVLLPSFVFAQTEGNIASYFANKKFDSKTISAFLNAVKAENYELVNNYLVKNPSIANVSDEQGNTGLMYAAKKGNISLMKLLTNKGAYVNTTNDDGNSALCLVFQNASHSQNILPAVNLLINLNAHINISCSGPIYVGGNDMKDYAPLHYAVWHLLPDVTAALLKHGAKIDTKASLVSRVDNNTVTVYPADMIFYANSQTSDAVFGQVTMSLVNAKAKFKQYKDSNDLLEVAIHASGHYDSVLDTLLSKKVIAGDINSYKLYYGTPLTEAVCYGASLPRIKVLVKHGAKVTNKAEVETMLQCAANDSAVANYLNELGYK